MTRWKPTVTSFTAGELSPRLEGRIDLNQYVQGCRRLENATVFPHGGVSRRSGTRFIGSAKSNTNNCRLLPFVSSQNAAYVLEFGDQYIRFYNQEAQLAGPLEVATPYLHTELRDLQWAQAADVMYLVHPNHPLHRLTRTGTEAFTLAEIDFDGSAPPFQIQNKSNVTVNVSGAGPFTLTFSADIGLTTEKDVGRNVAIDDSGGDVVVAATGDIFKITSVTSGSVATADKSLERTATSGGATLNWALSMHSSTRGFNSVALHEGRLWLGGTADAPNRLAASRSDDFENFRLGTGLADQSITFSITGSESPNIQWLATSGEKLHVGCLGMEFYLKGENNDLLTPGGAFPIPTTTVGSEHIQPVLIGSKVVFVQRAASKLRELGYRSSNQTESGFDATDLTILAEHILKTKQGGATEVFYQQEPDSVIWAVRADGQLVGITREIQQEVIGAHRQIIGGSYNGGKARVESACAIPAPSGQYDQVWMCVVRTINGATVRYIEFMEEPFDPAAVPTDDVLTLIGALEEGFFVDSGLTLDAPIALTNISQANPAVASTDGPHGLVNGDRVRLRAVVGMTEVNSVTFIVDNVTAATFSLRTVEGFDVDSTTYQEYLVGGTVRKEVTVLGGLSHLEGETVDILADGSPEPPRKVVGGQITLDTPASIVHAGLNYVTDVETQRAIGGARVGTGLGEETRIKAVNLRLYESLGVLVGQGPLATNLERYIFRDASDPMDRALPIFSGDVHVPLESDWTTEPTVFIRQDQPLPLTVLALQADTEIGEK